MSRSLVLSLALLPALTLASDYSARYDSCLDSANSTLDITGCIHEEYQAQDARLNQAYRTLSSQLDKDNRHSLLTAQRLWIKFRDANCTMYARLTGGSIDRINSAECQLRMTSERAGELERAWRGE